MGETLISVVILTKDEEVNLPHAISSVQALTNQIFVVDSGSTDGTKRIAQSRNCYFVEHPFENQAQQLNWALNALPITTPWILRLDADETVTEELSAELLRELQRVPPDVSGFEIKRRVYFMGKWIRHGGYYPTWLFRIWRHGHAICETRWMDEHMMLLKGRLARLGHDIIDENHKGISFWVEKHNQFASREVKDILGLPSDALAQSAASPQALRRRWLKKGLYLRSPRLFRAFAYFLFRMTFLGGFLDGRRGLAFHFLQGCWYRFLVDVKLLEHDANLSKNKPSQNAKSQNPVSR